MANTSTYLNFPGNRGGIQFLQVGFRRRVLDGIMRHGDVPLPEGAPALSDEDKNQVMNVALPILSGHVLMGSDIPQSMGHAITQGNNCPIVHGSRHPRRGRPVFAALSAGGHGAGPLAGNVLGRLLRRASPTGSGSSGW